MQGVVLVACGILCWPLPGAWAGVGGVERDRQAVGIKLLPIPDYHTEYWTDTPDQVVVRDTGHGGVDATLPCDIRMHNNKEPRTFIGCVKNDEQNVLLQSTRRSDNKMEVGRCLDYCRREGYLLAGLQAGDECYCGDNTTDPWRLGTDYKCQTRCVGRLSRVCGGDMRLSLYVTAAKVKRYWYLRDPLMASTDVYKYEWEEYHPFGRSPNQQAMNTTIHFRFSTFDIKLINATAKDQGRYCCNLNLAGKHSVTNCTDLLYYTSLSVNKTTYQSSTRLGGEASRALDGDKDPDFTHGSCTHTGRRRNPWWTVDLGSAQTSVDHVLITNRADCCRNRLRDFHIGLTNTSVTEQRPTLQNTQICARVKKALGKGETKTIECIGIGRYLVIGFERKEALTLCEVEVYGKPGPSFAETFAATSISADTPSKGFSLGKVDAANLLVVFVAAVVVGVMGVVVVYQINSNYKARRDGQGPNPSSKCLE